MKKPNTALVATRTRASELFVGLFLGLFLGACSGMGPTDFISPGALNPAESTAMGGFADADSDETAAENELAGTEAAPASAEVIVDGYTHEITTTSETVNVGEDIYAIPQSGQNDDAGFDAVVALDSESILSGQSPFGFSAATEDNEENLQTHDYDDEDFSAIPMTESDDQARDDTFEIANEENQNVPTETANRASAEDEEGLNETELGDEILVAQLPVPPAKEDEEPCDPNETTQSVALPIQSAGATQHPELPVSAKAKQTVILVPADLVGPCSEVEIEALPPALRSIRNTLVINQAQKTKTANTNARFLDYPCEDEGDVIPVVCRVNPRNKDADAPKYVWQTLPKTTPTNKPAKTAPDISTSKKPKVPDTSNPRIRPSIKSSDTAAEPQKAPTAPTSRTPVDQEDTRNPPSKATAPKTKAPEKTSRQSNPGNTTVKTKTPTAAENTIYIDLSSTEEFEIPANPASKTPAKTPAKTAPVTGRTK